MIKSYQQYKANWLICGSLTDVKVLLFAFFLGAIFFAPLGPTAHAQNQTSGLILPGTIYQTPYYVKTGAQPGPTIIVMGGLHGDETAGYLAARQLRSWKVESGTLVLVPDANVPAIQADRRFVGRNMNALFPGKKDGDGNQRLAYALWQLIKNSKPDLLLTLHESRGFYAENRARYGQTFTFDLPPDRARFARVASAVNTEIAPGREQFRLKMEAFPTCPTYCATKYLGAAATSIETARPLPLARRVDYQLRALSAFFAEWQMQIAPPTSAAK